ncbi:MAG: DUF58 domain-containing protein [Planctomycetota bacterium]
MSDVASSELPAFAGSRAVTAAGRLDRVLRADFCPWANRWVYWMKAPLWCVVLATGLSLAIGLFVNPVVLLLTAVLVLLGSLAAVLPWLTMRGLECVVSLDQSRGRVGESLGVRLRIRNRRIWPAWGVSICGGFPTAREDLGASERLATGVALARIPGRADVEYMWRITPVSHGSYPLSVPRLETGFPFGIFRSSREVRVEGRTIVWPATVSLSGLPDAPLEAGRDELMSDRVAGETGDLLGTRLFRAGDSLRRVHWAQTARQQQLVVTERQSSAGSVVRVQVDSSADSYPNEQGIGQCRGGTWELVIRTAASICESLHQQHGRVELLLGAKRWEAGESGVGFRQLMDALSTAEPAAAVMSDVGQRGLFRGAGAVIRISTPAGLAGGRFNGCAGGGQERGLCVSAVAVAGSGNSSGGWKCLDGIEQLETRLPRLWKELCHVR